MPPKNLKVAPTRSADEMATEFAKVFNDSHTRALFLPKLQEIGGRTLDGHGVNLAIELAIYQYTRTMPPLMSSAVGRAKDRLIDVVTSDPEVASDARAVAQEVRESVRDRSKDAGFGRLEL